MIYNEYGFKKDKPIFILYPWKIKDLDNFKKLNEYVYAMYRMYLIPIFEIDEKRKKYIKNILMNSILYNYLSNLLKSFSFPDFGKISK